MPYPQLDQAQVNGTSLVLFYNGNLSPTGPALETFVVTADGVNMEIASAEVTSPSTVEITLTNPVTDGQQVLASYTDPTSGNDANAIQDVDGTDTDSFTEQAVQNMTDQITPTVTISVDDSNLADGETANVTFTFSEPPVGFTSSDVQATNGSISEFTGTNDPRVFKAVFTPTATGQANIAIDTESYTDATGTPGLGDNKNLTAQVIAPTVSVSVDDANLASGETAKVTFSFSDAPVGFTDQDVTVTNGSISDFEATGDPKVYTAIFTPTAEGAASVAVQAGSYADADDRLGEGDSKTLDVDFHAPTVTVSVDDDTLLAGQSTTVTFTFSEAPEDFGDTDVMAYNGVVTDLAVDHHNAKVYTATFTAGAMGPAGVGVPMESYTDKAGNLGESDSAQVTVQAAPVTPSQPDPGPPAPIGPTEQADVITLPTTGGDVAAGGGSDQVMGLDGDDHVQGNAGADTLSGGAGVDVVLGGRDDDLVQGNAGADIVYGDLGDDIVHGGRDGDLVQGNSGADIVFGDAGDDVVHGGMGDDQVIGGDGLDFLFGDQGDDLLVGGQGADVFGFNGAIVGQDRIMDFSQAEGDRILIGHEFATDFAALAGKISANADGDTVIDLGDQVITIADIAPASLTASDFLFS